jgi:hypothetical protein
MRCHAREDLLQCHPCFRISAVYSLMSSSEIKHPGERFASRVRVGGRGFKSQVPRTWKYKFKYKVRVQVKVQVKWSEKIVWKCGKRSKVPLSFESELEFFGRRYFFRYLLLLISRWCDCGWDQKTPHTWRIRRTAYFCFPLIDWLIGQVIETMRSWSLGYQRERFWEFIFRIVPSCYGMKCPVRRKDMLELTLDMLSPDECLDWIVVPWISRITSASLELA